LYSHIPSSAKANMPANVHTAISRIRNRFMKTLLGRVLPGRKLLTIAGEGEPGCDGDYNAMFMGRLERERGMIYKREFGCGAGNLATGTRRMTLGELAPHGRFACRRHP
jgi:hypothetical protein